ncbi:unnamed protein product [Linum trigynum]|uniref:Uncharacterized protein n=1 Tax=Linum trigynum TaxID=586398 RepID=A0AAV2C961_9ROSI
MASSAVQPSNYTFPVNWPMISPRRRSFRGRSASSPSKPPPKSTFCNKLPPGRTTITGLKDDSNAGVAPAPANVVVRLRVGDFAFTVGKIAPNYPSPPRQIGTTSTVIVDKLAPNCHRDFSSPPQEIAGFELPYRKSSPTAAFFRSEIAADEERKKKQQQGEKENEKGKEKEKEEEKKRKFSLLLTEEQIEEDILAARTLAAERSFSDGNNHSNNKNRRYVRSCKRRRGFSFRVSKEEAEQDLGPVTDGKRLRRAIHNNLIPALKGFY